MNYPIEGLTLRKLNKADKAAMMAAHDAVIAALPDPRWYYPSEEWEFDAWLEGEEAVGYFDGETLCGFAVITPAAKRPHSYAQVLGEEEKGSYDFHDVLVLPRYRGLGMHTMFLRMFTDLVKEEGGKAIYATVDPENGASWRNFEKAGYKCIRVQPAYDGRDRRYYKLTI